MRSASVLEQENTLPRSELYFPIDNWHGFTGARQHHANMGRAIIAALGGVDEVIRILWHKSLKKFFKIAARSRVGIFHHDKTATRVLNKNRDCSIANATLSDSFFNLVGNFVGALALGLNGEMVGLDAHR